MNHYAGKVAIVTGASSGIGAAIAKSLVEEGLIVVGLARRKEKIEELAKEIHPKGKLLALKTDMSKEEDILRAFKWTTDNVGPVSVLINNAGSLFTTNIIDGDSEKWRKLLDLNVLGLTIASREAIQIMKANNIDGYIINMNSITGHKVPNLPMFNLYPASKFAVTALSETLRLELIRCGSKIRVSVCKIQETEAKLKEKHCISPGAVLTEIFGEPEEGLQVIQRAFKAEVPLAGEDVANAIKYILSIPAHVQVTELIIEPVGEIV